MLWTLPASYKDWLVLWLPWASSWTTIYDASPYKNNWQLTNSPVLSRKGKSWKQITFSWSNNIIIPDSASLDCATNALTISCWINRVGWQNILYKLTWDWWYWLTVTWTSQLIFLIKEWNTIDSSYSAANAISANVYSHIVWTFDWTYIRIFVNWSQVNTTYSTLIDITAWTWPLVIWSNDTPANYYTGSIKNTMIWNRALSQQEIQWLYYAQWIK